MKKYSILLFTIFASAFVFSQENSTRFSSIQADFFYGIPIEHDKSLENALQGNSIRAHGMLLSWNKASNKNSKFNTLYNYPEKGYSFLYENFNSTVLGETFGLYRHFTYNLTPSRKINLKLTTGFGVGYATKIYDKIENPDNFAIGSHILASAFFKLQYIQLINKNLSFNSSISIIHFSNMSYINPNLGINTLALHLGVNYKLNSVEIHKKDTVFNIDKSIKYHLILRGGYNESKIINSGLYPFFVGTFSLSKTINYYSTLTGGVDYFNSQFLNEYAKYMNSENGRNYPENNPHRVGIFIGHELTQNHFAFITQLGYYIYNPIPYESSGVYERIGFNYKLSKHLITELTLKVNLFRAEALEFGIGYTF